MALNRDGDRTKLGGEWNARGVRRILSNPLYSGILINHKYEIEDFLTGKQVPIPREDWYYHQRPEWAIVTPERFRQAQRILSDRRKQYDSGEPFRQGRYSGKHTFSTLIKCAHCGRSFTRKSYTYVNTRVYWRCVTNDQYTAERCDNRTIVDESELLQALRNHFRSLIGDREAFIAEVLATLDRRLPGSDPAQARKELEAKRRRLEQKRSRWQELYADDLISLAELKDRLAALAPQLDAIGAALTKPVPENHQAREIDRHCRREIEQFLDMETVTNADLRRIIDCITVSRDGNVRVVLKQLEDMQ